MVQDNQADLPTTGMCELIDVPPSSFFAWVNNTPVSTDLADVELLEAICAHEGPGENLDSGSPFGATRPHVNAASTISAERCSIDNCP